MGVVHKLKDEVRDFILVQKNKNPKLSCRALVEVVNKRFGLEVSKSSINAIIQQASLSSKVGRPRVRVRIETQPETNLSAELKKDEPLLIEFESRKQIPEVKPLQEIAPPVAPPEIKPEIPQKIPEDKLPLEKEAPELPQAKERPSVEPLEIKSNEIIENLGFFFLKASEWQFSSSILTEIIRPYLAGYDLEELKIKSQALLYLCAMGIKDLEAIKSYEGKDIWIINQSSLRYNGQELFQFAEEVKGLKSLPLALLNASQEEFLEAGYLKIMLADNTVLYIDAQFKTIWQDSDIPAAFSSTFYKTKNSAKEFFLDSSRVINLSTTPGYVNFSKQFYEFMYGCENLPHKRILRLSLHNQQKEEISPPVRLAPLKRYFTAAFWPWQQEAARFFKEDSQIIKSFFIEELEREIFYSESRSFSAQNQPFPGLKLRAVLLRDTSSSSPRMGILTNLPQEKTFPEIILSYLTRWPNQDDGYQDFLKKTEKINFSALKKPAASTKQKASEQEEIYSLSSEKLDLWQNINFLINRLSSFSQKQFFPKEYEKADYLTMKQKFYTIPGEMEFNKGSILVSLTAPAGYNFTKELSYAAKRVNEADIRDPLGNRLWLKVK